MFRLPALGALFRLPPVAPARQAALARALYSPQAVDRLVEMLFEIPDPDKVLEEKGLTRKDLRALEYDDEIAAALETRETAVIGTPWRLEPDGADADTVEWIQRLLADHVETIIATAWQAVPYGYSVIEAVYRREADGRIGWAQIEERPLEWFRPRPDGGLRFFPPDGSGVVDGIEVDQAFKFFLTRRRSTYLQPYGYALLSRLYWPWYFRVHGWQFWARFLERFGSPFLLGKTQGSVDRMLSALSQAVGSATVAVPHGDEVDVVWPGAAGNAFDLFANAVDKRIQKVVLGQTLTSDVGHTGSYAAAKVHNEVRDDRRLADVRMVSRTVQRMIDALVGANVAWGRGRNHQAPLFVMEDEVGLQPERADRDAKLVQAGILRLTPDYLLRAYDFDQTDFEIPEPEQAPGIDPEADPEADPEDGTQQRRRGAAQASFAAEPGPRFTPEQQAVEDLADEALARAGSPIPVATLRAAIRAAKSPEDLYERLAAVYSDNDPRAFRSLMERALFAADVLGYAHLEQETGADGQS